MSQTEFYNNKTVAITGASSGMGRSYALLLAQQGANVVLGDVAQEGLQETVALVQVIPGVQVVSMHLDVSDEAQWDAFKELCESRFGGCDMLINNAGIEGATKPVWASSTAAIKQTMDINFYGVVYGCRAFLPLLVHRPWAAIVNVSSIFGFIGTPNASDYCASKFAVRGYTESLMVELAHVYPQVQVHLVHPGGVATDIARSKGTAKFKRKFLTTPSDEMVNVVLQQIQRNTPRIVYGNHAKKTYWLSKLLPLTRLKQIISKGLKLVDPKDYAPDHKGFK